MHTMIEVMDDAGKLLGPNEIGEIVVRSNIVMMEYYNDPEATREVAAVRMAPHRPISATRTRTVFSIWWTARRT